MNFWCYIVVENGREKDMFSSIPAAERGLYGARVLVVEGRKYRFWAAARNAETQYGRTGAPVTERTSDGQFVRKQGGTVECTLSV